MRYLSYFFLILSFSAVASIDNTSHDDFIGFKETDRWIEAHEELVYPQIMAELRKTRFKNCTTIAQDPETDLIEHRMGKDVSLGLKYFNIQQLGLTRRGKWKRGYGAYLYRDTKLNVRKYKFKSQAAGPYEAILYVTVTPQEKISRVVRVECSLTPNGFWTANASDEFESECKARAVCSK